MLKPNRRTMMIGAASLVGASLSPFKAWAQVPVAQEVDPDQIYGAVHGEPFPVPAVDTRRIRYRFLRTAVEYKTDAPAGTIIIDPSNHFLYLTDGNGGAIRYGVGVGKQGFEWSGVAHIEAKREWPDWYPPKEMLARRPDIMSSMSKLQSGIGMHGGSGNPLGARAMYLFQGSKDTLYRIHGTIEPYSIGSSVSSGCIRMINQDVLDLYDRVEIGTEVRVLGSGGRADTVARDENFDQQQYDEPAPRRARGQDPQDYSYDGNGNLVPAAGNRY